MQIKGCFVVLSVMAYASVSLKHIRACGVNSNKSSWIISPTVLSQRTDVDLTSVHKPIEILQFNNNNTNN